MAANPGSEIRTVLVTRPAGTAADGLRELVAKAGYEVYLQPLLELHALNPLPGAQRQKVLDLDRYQHVIFISANAVHFGMALVDEYWPQLPVKLNWYAIGAATAAELERYGIAAITPGDAMTSEDLLAVAPLQIVRDQRVLIVKGEGGRDTLRQTLSERGALVDELACYRRSIPDVPAGELAAQLQRWEIDAILLSSGEGLSNLLHLLTPAETSKLKHIGLVVPSPRIAGMARAAGFEQIVTAVNASDAAMLSALQQWQPDHGE